jgi:hypothetical protein
VYDCAYSKFSIIEIKNENPNSKPLLIEKNIIGEKWWHINESGKFISGKSLGSIPN